MKTLQTDLDNRQKQDLCEFLSKINVFAVSNIRRTPKDLTKRKFKFNITQ